MLVDRGTERSALDSLIASARGGLGSAPVGRAVLNVVSEGGGERPLLCVVGDAQWLDKASAQALAFAARRLLAEPVALIFAAREPTEEFTGLPELLVRGLEDADARALLGE